MPKIDNTISLLVIMAYECVLNEEDDTLTITANVDRRKVVESLGKLSKHAVVQSTRFNRE